MTSTPLAQGFHPDDVYLDTPTYGLPPAGTVEALQTAVERWTRGVATMEEYDDAVARSRETFAQIVGVSPSAVAVANQVSVFSGLIAAGLPEGAKVVVAEGEFTSVLFPLLVNQGRGLHIDYLPLEQLADGIQPDTDLVAFSMVQSADGRLAEIEAIEASARTHGARMLVDITQAAGWLPIDAARFDYTVASAYKWLLSPRGTAFMTLGSGHDPSLRPLFAGWYAGEEVWKSIYGGPLRLASSARRYDVSPAWLSWMGTLPALGLIADLGVDRILKHNLALADMARRRLGLPTSGSAMVMVPLTGTSRLADRGIRASVRVDAVRVGFHLYNDESHVEALVNAVSAG